MRDAISIPRVQLLHPKVRNEVTAIIEGVESTMPAGESIRITQGLRTIEEQDALYAQGRTKPGKIVTKAKGGSSFHNYGLAVDVAIVSNGQIVWDPTPQMIAAFKAAGWEWGGDFKSIKDKPHFQRTFGKTIAQLRTQYKAGEYVSI